MSKNIVYEGWLTKSPPTKRIWRAKWRRRWFALRQSGELPDQYLLDYYVDRNCRRWKGTINLDLCEQVDAGLHMSKSGSGSGSPKLRGSVFTVRTSLRTYHLEADSKADMEKWVDTICQVCGLRATDESGDGTATYHSDAPKQEDTIVDAYDTDAGSPYIPISECITGAKNERQAMPSFYHRPKHYTLQNRVIASQPKYMTRQLMNEQLSESYSDGSEEIITVNGPVVKGPPVPPRPPKTLPKSKEAHKLELYGPKLRDGVYGGSLVYIPSLNRSASRLSPEIKNTYTENPPPVEDTHIHPSNVQYYNLGFLPPFVDRALKPRTPSHSAGHIQIYNNHHSILHNGHQKNREEMLNYLDLDLHNFNGPKPKSSQSMKPENKVEFAHVKSHSDVDHQPEYKSVDMIKTEAFNMMRKNVETMRNMAM